MSQSQNQGFPWGIFFVVAILGLFLVNQRGCTAPAGPDGPLPPAPSDCPDLRAAFAKSDNLSEAAHDAKAFSSICQSFADIVKADGEQAQPRLTKGVHLDDLRLAIRKLRMRGWSFSSRYSDLPQLLDAYLTSKIGTDGGPLTEEQRKKWIDAYESLAKCSLHAANSLQ